jgi:hypothetical protein
MAQRSLMFLAGSSLALALACGRDATSPFPATAPVAGRTVAKFGQLPGAKSYGNAHGVIACAPRDPEYGTAVVGPNGGELVVGPHRVIIPPGALTQTVEISGTVPTDNSVSIYLEPTGLQFKKPVGLILDATSCADVPDAVYVDELGVPSAYITATYSNWWHTVAAPIDHFSGYAIAF